MRDIKAVIPLRKDIYQIVTKDILSGQRLLSSGIDLNGIHFALKNEMGQDTVIVTIRGMALDFSVLETLMFLKCLELSQKNGRVLTF